MYIYKWLIKQWLFYQIDVLGRLRVMRGCCIV